MYIILMYDMDSKRVGKMLKLCRQYLNWIQNSVFEGEISPPKLRELSAKMKMIMDEEYDSVIIFKHRRKIAMDREVIGVERNPLDDFI
ncbi:CRISPR-associated endonuclease Cas2 [Bernardetia sp. Wsw4-3y2]|uniref:CRISPR-associated endonuclease Cas2 n=1 Tax=Bernardetia sp. Wsw4-3y2 TaxID=3127471 RepID=UPI0030CD1215